MVPTENISFMEMEINDITYFVKPHQQDGSKPYLILLHGFMGSGRAFDALIPSFKSICNPVTVDLLGHGKTENAATPERFKTRNQVDDLSVIIQYISSEPVYLYGYSMGGRLALQLARSKPKLLEGLILESANPGLKDKQKRDERKQVDKQRARNIETDFEAFLEHWKQLPLFNNETGADEHLERYQQIQQQQNPQQMAFSLRGFGTGQMPYVNFDNINIPSLLIAGEKDEKYIKIMTSMNRRISKSRLEIISGANHRVHLDRPVCLTKKLKDFMT